MKDGKVRSGVQEQGNGEIVAAGERRDWRGLPLTSALVVLTAQKRRSVNGYSSAINDLLIAACFIYTSTQTACDEKV